MSLEYCPYSAADINWTPAVPATDLTEQNIKIPALLKRTVWLWETKYTKQNQWPIIRLVKFGI